MIAVICFLFLISNMFDNFIKMKNCQCGVPLRVHFISNLFLYYSISQQQYLCNSEIKHELIHTESHNCCENKHRSVTTNGMTS